MELCGLQNKLGGTTLIGSQKHCKFHTTNVNEQAVWYLSEAAEYNSTGAILHLSTLVYVTHENNKGRNKMHYMLKFSSILQNLW